VAQCGKLPFQNWAHHCSISTTLNSLPTAQNTSNPLVACHLHLLRFVHDFSWVTYSNSQQSPALNCVALYEYKLACATSVSLASAAIAAPFPLCTVFNHPSPARHLLERLIKCCIGQRRSSELVMLMCREQGSTFASYPAHLTRKVCPASHPANFTRSQPNSQPHTQPDKKSQYLRAFHLSRSPCMPGDQGLATGLK